MIKTKMQHFSRLTAFVIAVSTVVMSFGITTYAADNILRKQWFDDSAVSIIAMGDAAIEDVTFINAQESGKEEGDGTLVMSINVDYTTTGWSAYMIPYGNTFDVLDLANNIHNSFITLDVKADSAEGLDGYYITLAGLAIWEVENSQVLSGVPLSEFYSESDIGTWKSIKIPLHRFLADNFGKAFRCDLTQSHRQIDFRQIWYCGVVWDAQSSQTTETAGSLLIDKMNLYTLAAPGSLNINKNGDVIELTWPRATGATGYEIFKNGELFETITSASTRRFEIPVTDDSEDLYAIRSINSTHGIVSDFVTGTTPTKITQLFDYAWQFLDSKDGYTKTYYNMSSAAQNSGAADKLYSGTGYQVKVEDHLGSVGDVRTYAWGFSVYKPAIVAQTNPIILWVGRANDATETGTRYVDLSKNYKNVCLSVNIYMKGETSLDGYYIVLGDGANGFNAVGLPLSDYLTIDGANAYSSISIPVIDFVGLKSLYKEKGSDRELDLSKIRFGGIAWNGTEVTGTPEPNIGFGQLYFYDASTPKNVTLVDATDVEAGTTSTTLRWSGYEYVCDTYEIFRDGVKIAEVPSHINSFTDTGLTPTTEYTYKVRAISRKTPTISGFSDEIVNYTSYIGKPRDFDVKSVNGTLTTKLSWNAPSYGIAQSYSIYRDGEKIADVDGSTYQYIDDSDIIENTYHTYAILSNDIDGNVSALTEEIEVLVVRVNVPQNLSYNKEDAQITWEPVDGAVSYNVLKEGVRVANVTECAYTTPEFTADGYHSYTVKAITEEGLESLESKPLRIFIQDLLVKAVKDIYRDSINDDYPFSSENVSEDKEFYYDGTSGIKLTFNAQNGSKANEGFIGSRALDASAMRTGGSKLGMVVYLTDRAIEKGISAYVSSDVKFNGTHTACSYVPLADIANLQPGWNYITIPFSSFPANGEYSTAGKDNTAPLNFNAITGFGLSTLLDVGEQSENVWIDEVKFIDYNLPVVNSVVINGASVADGDTVLAGTTSTELKFDTAMKADKPVTAQLKAADGTVVNTYVEYNNANNSWMIYFLDRLAANTAYTLRVSGGVSKDGTQMSEYTLNFKTDASENYTAPEISKAFIMSSVSASYGGGVTVPVTVDSIFFNEISSLAATITYDEDILSISGKSAVALGNIFKGKNADVDISTAGVIKITVADDGSKWMPEGIKLADISFVGKNSGTSAVSVQGTFGLSGTQAVLSAANANVTVNAKVTTNGGSGGGGGGGFAGGRPSAGTSTPPASNIPTLPDNDKLFNDIYGVEWAHEAIESLVEIGCINGYGDKTFKPNNAVTREEVIKMIITALDLEDGSAQCDFTDISEDAWYYTYVSSAQKLGIVNGDGDGSFGVGRNISRQEMCTILYRAAQMAEISLEEKVEKIDFTDADLIADWAMEAVSALQKAGVVNGVGNNEFSPETDVNRAMAAKALYELRKGLSE